MLSGAWLNVRPLKTMRQCVSFQCSLIFERTLFCMKTTRLRPLVLLTRDLNEDKHGALVEWYRHRKIGVLGEKPVPVSLRLPRISQSPVRGWTRDFAVWHRGCSLKFIERIIKVQFLSHRDQTVPPLQTESINAVLGNNWFILKIPLKHAITLSAEGTVFH